MYRLIETILIHNGVIHNAHYHNERMNHARRKLFNSENLLHIDDFIKIPGNSAQPVKCRILYSDAIEDLSYEPYTKRNVTSLKLVYDDTIDYSLKYEDRSHINRLVSQKDSFDDILIVKNGLVTDTSFTNIVFFDGKKFVTPKRPLLEGIRRRVLLERGIVTSADIRPEDLSTFKEAILINAMFGLYDGIRIEIKNIL
jgi:4-amino-4-deoxychorismate lyase